MATAYPNLVAPPSGPAAFERIGEDTSLSQAAILLEVGNALRRADPTVSVPLAGSVAEPGSVYAEFPIPPVVSTRLRVPRPATRARIRKRYGKSAVDAATPAWAAAYADCARALYAAPSAEAAAEVFELALEHPRRLVALAAAAGYFALAPDPKPLLRTLAAGTKSADELERALAATALARIEPAHPSLRALSRARRAPKSSTPTHTAILVHGTWASNEPWWQPGGDFHTFIGGLRSDLYGGADRFGWSGGYSDAARAQAADELVKWVGAHAASGLHVVAHSHGASATMLATANGLVTGDLVLLSCPVHAGKYAPDFARCRRVVSVRVKLDLVILADGGAQHFTDPRIEENVLPIWFNHGASHDPAVWTQHSIAAKIGW